MDPKLIIVGQHLDCAISATLFANYFKSNCIAFQVIDSVIEGELATYCNSVNKFDEIILIGFEFTSDKIKLFDKPKITIVSNSRIHAENKLEYKNAKTLIETDASCSYITYNYLKTKHTFAENVIKLVSYGSDYWSYKIEHAETLKLNAIYRSYNKPRSYNFVNAFIDGIRHFTVDEKNSIKLYFKKFKEQLNNNVFFSTIKDYTVVATFANYAVHDVAQYLIKKYNCDIGIVVIPQINFVCFRRHYMCNVNLSLLAQKLCAGDGTSDSAAGNITETFQQLTKSFVLCNNQ